MDYDEIKKMAICAMFADDELMDTLVLKGGNALDIVYQIAPRSSIDLDFSIKDKFQPDRLETIKKKLQHNLEEIFAEKGYQVFDVTFETVPEFVNSTVPDFWGGYQITFKIIRQPIYQRLKDNVGKLRRNAEVTAPSNRKKFRIDISEHEYCDKKEKSEINGYKIFIYTPEMIVFEKFRAICQ
jgi:hypothetical protein